LRRLAAAFGCDVLTTGGLYPTGSEGTEAMAARIQLLISAIGIGLLTVLAAGVPIDWPEPVSAIATFVSGILP